LPTWKNYGIKALNHIFTLLSPGLTCLFAASPSFFPKRIVFLFFPSWIILWPGQFFDDKGAAIKPKAHVISSLNSSSTALQGKILNEIPVSLLKAMEALIALFISGKDKMSTKYFSLSITFIDFTSPLKFLTRLTTSALYSKMISFNSSDEDLPNIKNVFIFPSSMNLSALGPLQSPGFNATVRDKKPNTRMSKGVPKDPYASSPFS
jgi:hypothetical protein